MKYEIVFPVGAFSVEFTDLNDMVEQACRLSGKKAMVRRQLVIETDDLNLSMMFDSFRESLATGNGHKGQTNKVTRNAKAGKALNSLKSPAEMGRASRRIVATGEIYSLVDLKKRIADRTVPDGTVVENHRGEQFVVISGELIQEPKQEKAA